MTTADRRPLTADDLMGPPRGRSFVFALASRPPGENDSRCRAEAEPWTEVEQAYAVLSEATILATYRLDRHRGVGSAMFGPGAEDGKRRWVGPTEVAEKLRLIEPRIPRQSELQHAMAEMIVGAMYWQPPHSIDVLCVNATMVDALYPWAHTLVDSGLLDRWTMTLDLAGQWALAWDDSEHTGKLPAVLSADPDDLIRASCDGPHNVLASEDFMTVTENLEPSGSSADQLRRWITQMEDSEAQYRLDFAKDPYDESSGLWISTPPGGLLSTTGTWPDGEVVGLDLVEDDFGLERARACWLPIRTVPRIFEISRPEDWAHLCRQYPLDVTAQRRQVWFEATGRRGRWVIPDWSRVAEDIDGVHVSLAGYLRTAGVVVPIDDGPLVEEGRSLPTLGNTDDTTASLMAGWNPDATYWLNDVVTGIAEVVDWGYDEDADEWVRM